MRRSTLTWIVLTLTVLCTLILSKDGALTSHAASPGSLQFGNQQIWLTTPIPGGVGEWDTGDVTGDGKADLMVESNLVAADGSLQQTVYVGPSMGDHFAPLSAWTTNPCPQDGGCRLFELGDVNGDGKADLVAFAWGATQQPGWANVWVSLSDGNGFGPAQLWHSAFCIYEQACRVADVNGDGKADLVAFTPQTGLVWVSLSQGSTFGPNAVWQNYFCIQGEICYVRDVNGDGKADLIAFKPNASGVEKGNVLVALSNGTGFGTAQLWHGYFCINIEQCLIGDMNGDGKADVVLLKPWGNGLQSLVSLSDGSHFVNADPFAWSNTIAAGTTNALLADVTGDKKADLVTYDVGQDGQATFSVYPTQTAATAPCPPGTSSDPVTGHCSPIPNQRTYSAVDVYNCNTNINLNGEHRSVTIYLRDLSTAQSGFDNVATIDAQYSSSALCPYDDSGNPASAQTIDLLPYGNMHTIEMTVVDPELYGCDGNNDPTLDSCVRQRAYFIANQGGDTAKYTVY